MFERIGKYVRKAIAKVDDATAPIVEGPIRANAPPPPPDQEWFARTKAKSKRAAKAAALRETDALDALDEADVGASEAAEALLAKMKLADPR